MRASSLRVPSQFYLVLRAPAPLAGMEYPGPGMPWPALFDLGLSHVACLCSEHPGYDPAPLRPLLAVEMDDLHRSGAPKDPAKDERLVREAAGAIIDRLSRGEGVVAHCVGGTGRTGTVIGCVLRSLGYSADEAISYLDGLNKSRGRCGWPEAAWQAEMIRRF